MGEANYHEINDAVSDLDDQIDALQKAKRDLWANVRDEHGKKLADQIKLAVKLNRLGSDKRMERDEIEDGAFRILSILQQPRAPRATPAREIIEEFDAETGEIIDAEPVQEMHKLPEGEATVSESERVQSSEQAPPQPVWNAPAESVSDEISAPISPDPHDPQVDGGQPEQSSIAAGAKSDVPHVVGQGGQAPGRHYGEIEQQSASATQAGNEAGSASGASAPISDEGIPAFLKRERKPLRPNCLNPDNCAGYGTHTCHSCTVAAREVEPA